MDFGPYLPLLRTVPVTLRSFFSISSHTPRNPRRHAAQITHTHMTHLHAALCHARSSTQFVCRASAFRGEFAKSATGGPAGPPAFHMYVHATRSMLPTIPSQLDHGHGPWTPLGQFACSTKPSRRRGPGYGSIVGANQSVSWTRLPADALMACLASSLI